MTSPRRPCLVRNCARAQGPIATAVSFQLDSGPSFASQSAFVVMGPCVRRDDVGQFPIQLSNSKPAARPHSRGAMHPSFALLSTLLKDRGRREDRVRAAPAVSCATCTRKCAHEHTGPAGASRPSLRNGFTAYNALSPVIELICHRHRADTSARLDASFGRQDHTTSPYASCAFVLRTCRVHRIPPHVRDDRDPPLVWVRRAESQH